MDTTYRQCKLAELERADLCWNGAIKPEFTDYNWITNRQRLDARDTYREDLHHWKYANDVTTRAWWIDYLA